MKITLNRSMPDNLGMFLPSVFRFAQYTLRIFSAAILTASVCSPAAAQEDFTAQQTRLLTAAEATLAENPSDADALIWKGRRLGYLGRYEEAIAVYAAGEALHPTDARFARHIGHRLISLRRFADAEGALARDASAAAFGRLAAEAELAR
jgi:cytochrome c-type biogenesis protein CcmH/NrfG